MFAGPPPTIEGVGAGYPVLVLSNLNHESAMGPNTLSLPLTNL